MKKVRAYNSKNRDDTYYLRRDENGVTRRMHSRHQPINYKAIMNFLQSRVGREWDTVWSEICQAYDARTAQGVEVRRYVKNILNQWSSAPNRISFTWGSWTHQYHMYVNDQGILAVEETWMPEKEKAVTSKLIEPGLVWAKVDGFWYEFKAEFSRNSTINTYIHGENGMEWKTILDPDRNYRYFVRHYVVKSNGWLALKRRKWAKSNDDPFDRVEYTKDLPGGIYDVYKRRLSNREVLGRGLEL